MVSDIMYDIMCMCICMFNVQSTLYYYMHACVNIHLHVHILRSLYVCNLFIYLHVSVVSAGPSSRGCIDMV